MREALGEFAAVALAVLRLLYDNRSPGPDPALAEAAARLVPLEQMKRATPRPIRSPKIRS